MGLYHYELISSPKNSWLKFTEILSNCHFSIRTDKLITIARLVADKQVEGEYQDFENGAGFWAETFYIDLIETSRYKQNLNYLDSLGLLTRSPSRCHQPTRARRHRATYIIY